MGMGNGTGMRMELVAGKMNVPVYRKIIGLLLSHQTGASIMAGREFIA